MKNIILIITNMLILTLVIGIIMTAFGREAHSSEMKSCLSACMEECMENVMQKKNYQINDREEFLADFIQTLSQSLETEADLNVEVYAVDVERGLLSVRVREGYVQPDGSGASVSCDKTVIFNRLKEEQPQLCKIVFYLSDAEYAGAQPYKTMQVQKGDAIHAPADPSREGVSFGGWEDTNGYAADFSGTVEEDRVYVGMWH